MISVIIPLYNEEENISFLFQELERLFKKPPETMELILVDDGSKDQTFTLLVEAQKNWQYGRCRILRLRRNFGKGAALQAGLDLAYGEWIFTMDGDGQDNPLEFFKLWEEGKRGHHFLIGCRKNRQDPWTKIIPSRIYNKIISLLFRHSFRDINSGMRLFQKAPFHEISFYGHQYRLLPLLFLDRGYSVKEVEIDHRKRHAGKSKYGKIRFLTGLLDIWTLLFLTRFPFRPSHFFGAIGLLFAAIGFLINGYIAYLRLAYGTIQFRYPLLALGILLLLVGLQFIFTGFLSELLAFYLHENRKTYSVREIVDD